MVSRMKIIFLSISIIFLLVFCLKKFASNQTLPWSWPPQFPFPGALQYPISTWPQSGVIPTINYPQSSGWPLYQPIPSYSPPPGGSPASSPGCPVGLVTGLTFDEEFGPGTSQITRCLIFRNTIRLVLWVKDFEITPGRSRLSPIVNMINDYKITHGTTDFKIVTVVNMEGAWLMLNRNAAHPHPNAAVNIYQPLVEDLIARGVKFYL